MDEHAGQPGFPALSQASSREPPSPEALPEIEGYKILEELPRGGQAVVYKAIDKATGKRVALKVLPVALVSSASARRHFEREVELARQLSHPNIVAILDSGITRGQYYFAMDYIRGQTLDRYVAAQVLSLRDTMRLFSMICNAVTGAHQRGVIHRDLKPSNILIDEHGQPHVVDFGLAKAAWPLGLDSKETVVPTLTGEIKGTVAYMAPEQAFGPPDRVDVRADVYALGVVLYQMALGRFPYDVSGTALEVLDTIRSSDPLRPRKVRPRFDSDVEAILLKALAKDPAQRYQSAAELQHDVDCWLNGLPIVAKSVSFLYLLRKLIARHKYAASVAGLLAVTVLGFLGFSFNLYRWWQRAESQAAEVRAQLGEQTRMYSSLTQQAMFLHVLDLWHAGRVQEAKLACQGLVPGGKEGAAADLLLEERSWADKVERVRGLPGPNEFLLGFLAGEHLLKAGRAKEAEQAYRGCLSVPVRDGEELLRMRVRVRLYELVQGSP